MNTKTKKFWNLETKETLIVIIQVTTIKHASKDKLLLFFLYE